MKKINYFLFLGAASFMVACGSGTNNSGELSDSLGIAPGSPAEVNDNLGADNNAELTAVAEISGASGSEVTGTATFTQNENGAVTMAIRVENLSPGEHAIHLHEKGDCSAPDATSAGAHWNPTDDPHGKRGNDGFHAGDIDNLVAGEDGVATLEMEFDDWTIGGSEETNILNKAVIIHADPDDFESQPAGAAGGRIACGVIQASA
ncbi:MAG TPA: superoxide dismutase family protein [Cyclobacteriaceae bacterium]|nr:superoxide dismutase family protein [Cyclobacteriaceae bacterium]